MKKEKAKEKPRITLKFSYILIAVFLALVITYFLYRFKLQSAYKAKLDQIRASGLPADCFELDDWYSIPDGAENAADIFLDAFAFYAQWDEERINLLPIVGNAKLPEANEPLAEDVKKLIAEYLAENQKALDLLHKAAKIEHCRYPVNLSAGPHALSPYLSELRQVSLLLYLEAIYYADNKESWKTIESIESIFAAARSLSNEPTTVSQLVCLAGKAMAVNTLRSTIDKADFNDSQLKILDKILADTEHLDVVYPSLVGERCMGIYFFNVPVSEMRYFGILSGKGSFSFLDVAGLVLYAVSGMVDVDRLMYIDYMTECIEAAKLPLNQRLKALEALDVKIAKLPKFHILLHTFANSFSRVAKIELRIVTDIRTARVAIATKRYQLKNCRFPDNISELVPDFIPAVPKDPFDGNDVRYKDFDTGCIIYSVGEDGFDTCSSQTKLDIEAFGDDLTFIIRK